MHGAPVLIIFIHQQVIVVYNFDWCVNKGMNTDNMNIVEIVFRLDIFANHRPLN